MGAIEENTAIIKIGIDLYRYPNINREKIRKYFGIEKDDLVHFFMGFFRVERRG